MIPRLFASLALLASFALSPVAVAESGREMAQRLYRDSGMEVQVAAMPSQLSSGIAQSQGQWGSEAQLPDNFASELARRVEQTFDLARFRAGVIDRFERDLSKEQMGEVLRWLASPVGVHMTKLEEAAAHATAEEFAAYAQTLGDTPPSTHYVKQVQRLMRAVNAVDSTVEVGLMMQLGMIAAAVGATPDAPAGALGDAMRQLESIRPQLQQAIGDQVMLAFLYTYRTADPGHIGAYVAFATSPAGEAYHRVTVEGMALGLRDVSIELGKEIAAVVHKLLNQKQA